MAVLGCGNVGAALVGILQDRTDALAVQAGARISIAGIAVGDLDAPRPDHVPRELPTADVEGFDAAAKAAILAGVAFGYDVSDDAVLREGITGISADDVDFAQRAGYVIKLLAVVERAGADGLSVRVHPALVPSSHPLAGVRDAFNAVFIEGEAAGELMLYGQGAGGLPTASAVVGDLIDASRNLIAGTTAPASSAPSPPRSVTTGCRSGRSSRRAEATVPASSSSPMWHARATCGQPCPTWRDSTRWNGSEA